jgi:hypothetical protein
MLLGVASAVRWWARLYSDSKTVSNAVMSVHLIGMLVGGGGAVAADRDALRLARGAETDRRRLLGDLHAAHRWVLAGLGVTFVSGILQLLSDLSTFLGSVPYWIKMALIALLLGNGWWMTRLERRLVPEHPTSWGHLRLSAILSVALWCTIVVVSTFVATS